MKIAVASQNRREITGHTGHCRKFWIYTTENQTISGKTLLELPKEQCFHNSSPTQPSPLDDVQVLIAGGLGQGLTRRLEALNINPLVTSEKDPDRAVAAFLQGTLKTETLTAHEHCNKKP